MDGLEATAAVAEAAPLLEAQEGACLAAEGLREEAGHHLEVDLRDHVEDPLVVEDRLVREVAFPEVAAVEEREALYRSH